MHLARCPRLPEKDRRALDDCEAAKAAAGVGIYGSNPVYRGFEVTGWLVVRCKTCLKTVRGDSSDLKRHLDQRCDGIAVTWSEVDVESHFDAAEAARSRQCQHCLAVVQGDGHNRKQHLARCPRLPEKDRRELDESEVARAAAGAGKYGANHVYRCFEVTGYNVARCKHA